MPSYESPLRILMIGQGERFHLEPLGRCIKAADPSIHLEIRGLRNKAAGSERVPVKSSDVFDHMHIAAKHQQFALPGIFKPTPSVSRDKSTIPSYTSTSVVRTIMGEGLFAARAHVLCKRANGELSELQQRVDVLHLQSIFNNESLAWLALNGSCKPFVVTCYGSDLLRVSDPKLMLLQRRVLQRAAAITVTSPELKSILLSKFGFGLEPKVFNTFFDPGVTPFITADRSAARLRLEEHYPALRGRKLITVGHNATPECQHMGILSSLAKLPNALKRDLFLWVPMTYGGSGDRYTQAVASSLASHGLAGHTEQAFVDGARLLDWRAASDIFVYAATSDAFSASVSQALAAGSVGIIGSWLPYKLRTRAGFRYAEIDSVQDSADVLHEVLDNWSDWKARAASNRELSAAFFSSEKLGEQWVRVYRSAVNGTSAAK